jgi:hypothetical protein
MRARLLLARRKVVALPRRREAVGVVLLSASAKRAQKLAEVAVKVFAKVSKEVSRDRSDPRLLTVLCRAGFRTPLALTGDPVAWDRVAPDGEPQPPPLVAPVLEELGDMDVRFVVVVGDAAPADLGDVDPKWWRQGWRLWTGPGEPPGPWVNLWPVRHAEAQRKPEDEVVEEVRRLLAKGVVPDVRG